jgi:hypothetical protein
MIGHYLLTLCPEAEHDVLTGKMRPGDYGCDTARCLVGWTADTTNETEGLGSRPQHAHTGWKYYSVEDRYDTLCERFGTERINAAIRNRILSNQARRTLQAQHAEALGV